MSMSGFPMSDTTSWPGNRYAAPAQLSAASAGAEDKLVAQPRATVATSILHFMTGSPCLDDGENRTAPATLTIPQRPDGSCSHPGSTQRRKETNNPQSGTGRVRPQDQPIGCSL